MVVRQIEPRELGAFAAEQLRQLPVRLRVRPVAAPDRQRPLVQPEHVAAVGVRAAVQPPGDRHAGVLENGREPLRLVDARRLAHLKHDLPRARDEHGVVDEAAVDEPVRRGQYHDLDPERGEQLHERLVLSLQELELGRPPGRCGEISGLRRRADQHPVQRGRHRANAVRGRDRHRTHPSRQGARRPVVSQTNEVALTTRLHRTGVGRRSPRTRSGSTTPAVTAIAPTTRRPSALRH